MSIIEEVSNFRLAIPLKNRSAKSIAKVLEDRLISVFAPKCIVADKGTNLVLSKEVMKVLDQYGVAFHVGSAYASRSHGKIGQKDTNLLKNSNILTIRDIFNEIKRKLSCIRMNLSHNSDLERSNAVTSTLIRIMADKLNKPWPEVVPFVICLLNNQTTEHLQGYSAQFVLMGLHPALNQRFQRANRGIEDLSDISSKWTEHSAYFQAQYEKVNEKFNKIYENKGGVEHDFQEGDLVYMRDFRNFKPRTSPTWFRIPMRITRVLDAVIITEDLDGSGIVRLIHGKNAKKASPFSVEQYELLPEHVRIQLGHAFTSEELKSIMRKEGLKKMPKLFSLKASERIPWTSKLTIDPNIDLPHADESKRKSSVTVEDPLETIRNTGVGPSLFLGDDPDLDLLDQAMLDMQAEAQQDLVDGELEVNVDEIPLSEIDEKHVTFDLD